MAVLQDKDRKLLISLLTEYSERLLSICEKIYKHGRYCRVMLFILVFLLYLLGTLISNGISNIFSALPFVINIIVVVAAVYFDAQQNLVLLRQDARTISLKLEKIIRMASQVEENVANDFVNHLELDLRLTDAESALAHYISTMRRRF